MGGPWRERGYQTPAAPAPQRSPHCDATGADQHEGWAAVAFVIGAISGMIVTIAAGALIWP